MSIFLPYDIIDITTYFSTLDLSTISDFQSLVLTILVNAYFFGFWFFIFYFVLKSLNWVYERFF